MEKLTPREREVLRLIGTGLSCRGLAQTLDIAEQTVRKHRTNICRKLGFDSAARLIAYAVRETLAANPAGPSFRYHRHESALATATPGRGGHRRRHDQQAHRPGSRRHQSAYRGQAPRGGHAHPRRSRRGLARTASFRGAIVRQRRAILIRSQVMPHVSEAVGCSRKARGAWCSKRYVSDEQRRESARLPRPKGALVRFGCGVALTRREPCHAFARAPGSRIAQAL